MSKVMFSWSEFAAIHHLDLSIPEDERGGVVVLYGDEGSGKSTAISSINQLAQDKPSVPYTPLDGHSMGLFSGPGVVMRVYPTTHRFDDKNWRGNLRVSILNGVPLGTFINPNRKGDRERSEVRNKALAALVNLELSAKAFELMTKGSAELRGAILPETAMKLIDAGRARIEDHLPPGTNLLTAADLVRAVALDRAKTFKHQAEIAGDEAARQLTSGLELENKIQEMNDGAWPQLPATATVRESLEQATREAERRRQSYQARLDLEAQKLEVAQVLADKGERKELDPVLTELEQIQRDLPGQQQELGALTTKVTSLQGEATQLATQQEVVDRQIAELEAKLAVLQGRREEMVMRRVSISAELSAPEIQPEVLTAMRDRVQDQQARIRALNVERDQIARDHRERDALQLILDKSLDGYSDDADVQSADLEIDTLNVQLDQAIQRDRMEEHIEAHRQASDEAKKASDQEQWFRDVVWNVIPQVIAERLSELGLPGLDMRDGVLFGQHPIRGMVPFDELSPGQTVKTALQIALKGLERRGERDPNKPVILGLPQEFWDAMTPATHALVRFEARAAGVWIVTGTARHNGTLRCDAGVPEEERAALERLAMYGEESPEVETTKTLLLFN